MANYSQVYYFPIQKQNQSEQSTSYSAEDFASHLLKISIAQLAKEQGFDSVESSVLDILTEAMITYLTTIGKKSHAISEQGRRTLSTIDDVTISLRKMGVNLDDLVTHMSVMGENQFAKSDVELKFPIGENDTELSISKTSNPLQREMRTQSTASSSSLPHYIPSFLPPFPPIHNYKDTTLNTYRPLDNKMLGKIKHQQKQRIQNDLDHLNESLKRAKYEADDDFMDVFANNTETQTPVNNNNNNNNPNTKNNEDLLHYPAIPTVIPFSSKLFSKSKTKKVKTLHQHYTSALHTELEPKQTHSEVEQIEQSRKKTRAEGLLNLNHFSDTMTNDF